MKFLFKILFLLLVAISGNAQTVTFTGTTSNRSVTFPVASIIRCEKSPNITHDTRIYTGTTYTTVTTSYDSVRTLLTGSLIHVVKATDFKPMLINPKLTSSVTKSSGNKAIFNIGASQYVTTSGFDSVSTVVGAIAAGGSSIKRYVAMVSQSLSGAPTVTVLENSLGGDAPILTRASTGRFYIYHASFATASKVAFKHGALKNAAHGIWMETPSRPPTSFMYDTFTPKTFSTASATHFNTSIAPRSDRACNPARRLLTRCKFKALNTTRPASVSSPANASIAEASNCRCKPLTRLAISVSSSAISFSRFDRYESMIFMPQMSLV